MKKASSILLALAALAISGCMKPYDKPVYKDVASNETAFVIPLEQGVSAGVKFDSEQYLESKKVAAKRIQIPRRWNQTGRWGHQGEYIDTAAVLTVDRSPVTRQWENSERNSKTKNNAIWLESMDSIGFSTGFSVTAHIEEGDTARFLYSYKNSALTKVLDEELRARIQTIAGEVSASYKMDDLREKKNELITRIRDDVVPFFKQKGVTITTVGQFGGFLYENEQIQAAIDDTFVAQQAKVKNAALLEAQTDANARIELAAKAEAEAARTRAKGEADGKLSIFQAEADGITAVNKALAAANSNPQLVELKRVEVDRLKAEKWDGRLPTWTMGANGPGMMLSIQDGPR